MGRRALRHVDPRIDLSRFLRKLADLPPDWEPASAFARQAELEIEVGSGKGLFMSTEPLARPERNFLGIEIAPRYARFAAARVARQGIVNACMIAGDAKLFFQQHLSDQSVTAVHVYFPDPWWKKRHRKRRMMQADFLRQIDRVLRPHGTLHFWTDVQEYFEESLQIIAQTVRWQGPDPVAVPQAQHDLDYRTHFERRMRIHNLTVYRAIFHKLD